jgi:uncharacterized protein YacL
MFQRLFKWFFTIVGGLIGYEFFVLSNFLLVKFNVISELPGDVETWMTAIFVFIFEIIFYRIAPTLTQKSRKVAANI